MNVHEQTYQESVISAALPPHPMGQSVRGHTPLTLAGDLHGLLLTGTPGLAELSRQALDPERALLDHEAAGASGSLLWANLGQNSGCCTVERSSF